MINVNVRWTYKNWKLSYILTTLLSNYLDESCQSHRARRELALLFIVQFLKIFNTEFRQLKSKDGNSVTKNFKC